MDSHTIPKGIGRRPKKDWAKAKDALAKGQSPLQELEGSLRSGLYLLVVFDRPDVKNKQNLFLKAYFENF